MEEEITLLETPKMRNESLFAIITPSMEQMKNVCKCYASFLIILTLLLNYLWISPEPLRTQDHIYALHHYQCYLYTVSILSLVILCFSCRNKSGHLQLRCSVSWTSLALTIFLWMFSMIFCCYLLASFFSGTKQSSDIFTIARLNYFLLSLMVMLEIVFITQSTIYGEFIKPGFFHLINPLLKIHLLVTNISFLIQIITEDYVHYALLLNSEGNVTYNVEISFSSREYHHQYTIPPNKNDSEFCFSNSNVSCERNLWAYEETFKVKQWGYKLLSLIAAEFCITMVCVFFAMYSEEETVSDETQCLRPLRHKNIPLLGLFFGFLFFIVSIAFCMVDDQLKYPVEMDMIYNIFLLVIIAVIFIKLFFIKLKNDRSDNHKDFQQNSNYIDRYIIFCSLAGILLLNISDLIATISVFTFISQNIEFWSKIVSTLASFLQVLVISYLLRKKISPKENLIRNLIAILAFINLAIWIQSSFLLPESDDFGVYKNQIDIFGIFGWVLIWRVAQPFCVLFRFHSFVIFIYEVLTTDAAEIVNNENMEYDESTDGKRDEEDNTNHANEELDNGQIENIIDEHYAST